MPNKKPFKIFIGSSTENKKYATWVSDLISDIEKDEPDKFYEVTANGWWEKGIFRLMNSFYESLNDLVANFDAGIFIGGMEDLTIKRDKEGFQPRDNIILELGMFAGAKGKYLSLLTTIDIPELPSDLAGINVVNLKSTTDYNLFQKEARAHFREWLVLAKESSTKSETINKMHIHDPEIESIIIELIKDVNNASKIDSEIFISSIKTSLNLFAYDVNAWATGQLYIGPDRSVQFLLSLYRKAKKVFATSIKDFSTAWEDNSFGDEILKAHKESSADVTRIFWFTSKLEVNDEDMAEMDKQISYGVKVFLFFDDLASINIPTDIARDFTIIDNEIIGITETFGRSRNAAHYYFKDDNKNRAFFRVRDRLLRESRSFEEFNKSRQA